MKNMKGKINQNHNKKEERENLLTKIIPTMDMLRVNHKMQTIIMQINQRGTIKKHMKFQVKCKDIKIGINCKPVSTGNHKLS